MSLRFRNGRWYVRISTVLPDGSRFRKEVKSPAQTKKDALRFELEWRRALVDGSYFQKKVAPPTLAAFWPRYLADSDVNNKPATRLAKEIAGRLHILPALGKLPLAEVGRHLEQFKADLAGRLSVHTVNNALGYLRRALALAYEVGELRVVPHFRRLKSPDAEAAWLEPDEYARFLVTARDCWPERYPIVAILGETGLRIGEALALKWTDVDLTRRQLVVRKSVTRAHEYGTPKAGKTRVVDLSTLAVEVLKGHRHLRGEFVFTARDGKPMTHTLMSDYVGRIAKRAGIAKHVSNHSLRHSRTAYMVMAGCSSDWIKQQLGWTTDQMLRRYTHLSPGWLREQGRRANELVIEMLGRVMDGTTTGTSAEQTSKKDSD